MARIAVLLLVACALRAQSVEIAFTSSVTHAPVADFGITLQGPKEFTATSDGAGVARIANVPPGDYRLGLQDVNFWVSPRIPNPIHVGDTPVRLAFELTPNGKVQGRVLLPDRRPVAGAKVSLELYRVLWTSQTTTDAQGRFVVSAPTRGRFTLSVTPPPSLQPPDGEDWAVTYYPDVTGRADAPAIPLPLGADLSGYDIRLRSLPLRRVGGVVRDDAGNPAPGATVKVFSEKPRQVTAGKDGAFSLTLPMGEWSVLASLKRGETELLGFERLTVGRRDIESLDLRLAHPFTIAVTVEGVPNSAVALIPEPGRGYFQESAKTEPGGARRFRAVYPGPYTVQVAGYRPGYYLDSIRLGDREILGRRVDFAEGAPALRITYKPGAGSVRAKVEDGAGATVAILPQQPELEAMDIFLRSAPADADGRCELRDLRPGDYYAFAFEEYDREALKDPLFVSRIIPRAEKVHIDENGSATVSLKVTPWPE